MLKMIDGDRDSEVGDCLNRLIYHVQHDLTDWDRVMLFNALNRISSGKLVEMYEARRER